jgi:PucR family transcriptional regulator, purine catabolism regulatory protein
MINLATLIAPYHPKWLSGSDLTQGKNIEWVCRPTDHPGPGDLVIMESNQDLRSTIEALHCDAVSAIGIIGATDWRPAESQLEIPIFYIEPTPTSSRNILRDMLSDLLNAKAAWNEDSMRVHARLTDLAARSEGLPGLAAALCEITQHSILIQDKRLAPLASSPTAGLRPIWENLLEHMEELSTLPEMLRDRRQTGQKANGIRERLPGGLERIIQPIVAGDVARGYLSVVAPAGELDDTDSIAAEQGSMACAVEMAHAKAVRETEKRLHGDLLAALLRQNLPARDARLWALNTGLDLEQSHAAIRFSWEGSGLSIRRLETLVNGESNQSQMRVIVSQMGGEVIAFCETSRDAARPILSLALAQSVMDQAAREHPQAVLRCGIGTPARDMADWQLSFRQAGQALEMARRLDERKPLYFMDLSVYRLLLQIEDHPDLRAFLQESLGPLLAHENAVEFIATLEEYFAHNGNVSQTAEALFIHRNTLLYRMERIAAISHLDLNNPDTRLAAQLALRIHRMVRIAP